MSSSEEQIVEATAWDGHDLNRLASILFEHALIEIQCDHDAKTDRPVCACSLIELGIWPSVGAARQAWVDHVMAVVRGRWSADAVLRRAAASPPASVPSPPEPDEELIGEATESPVSKALHEISVDVVLADDLPIEAQIAALWSVVRRHTAIAKEALGA